MLQCYIDIQQISFDKPFEVCWDVDSSLLDCKILKLTLQPLVENAVMHGLKSRKGDQAVSIRNPALPAGYHDRNFGQRDRNG